MREITQDDIYIYPKVELTNLLDVTSPPRQVSPHIFNLEEWNARAGKLIYHVMPNHVKISTPAPWFPHASDHPESGLLSQGHTPEVSRVQQVARKMVPSWSTACHELGAKSCIDGG